MYLGRHTHPYTNNNARQLAAEVINEWFRYSVQKRSVGPRPWEVFQKRMGRTQAGGRRKKVTPGETAA